VVDVVAIRKNTSVPSNSLLKRGDLRDIILIQMKGGSAKLPGLDELHRLRVVAEYYRAREIMLFNWDRGRKASFSILDRTLTWRKKKSLEIFGV
jgi:hypothetical protein